MDPYEVGLFRRCPACGRPIMDGPIVDFRDYFGERGSSAVDMLEEIRCSCCERPFIACPCTPVEEGDCRSVRPG
jgi:hypothetical protein